MLDHFLRCLSAEAVVFSPSLTVFQRNLAPAFAPSLMWSNTFTDSKFLIKLWWFARARSPICPTDRDYSTTGSLLLARNVILSEPLMFWHDWLTKTPPIKATYRRKWDLWVGGSPSVTVCLCVKGVVEWVAGWSQRIAVVFLRKVNLSHPRDRWAMCWGFVVYGHSTVLRLLGVFTGIKEETLYSEITDSCASLLSHIIVQMSNCQTTSRTKCWFRKRLIIFRKICLVKLKEKDSLLSFTCNPYKSSPQHQLWNPHGANCPKTQNIFSARWSQHHNICMFLMFTWQRLLFGWAVGSPPKSFVLIRPLNLLQADVRVS